jgi:hypothetical protein
MKRPTPAEVARFLGIVLGLLVAAVIGLRIVGKPISSFHWAGAPAPADLEELIKTGWQMDPPRDKVGDVWQPRRVFSVTVLTQEVRQARYGRLAADTAVTYWTVLTQDVRQARHGQLAADTAVTYWTVLVTADEECFTGAKNSSDWKESWERTTREDRRVCYAWKSGEHWSVTFTAPTDETPFWKVW